MPRRTSAESEPRATPDSLVESVVATVDDVLADVADGEVGEVVDVREVDDGHRVTVEAVEHADDEERRRVSHVEVTVDDNHEIVEVERTDAPG